MLFSNGNELARIVHRRRDLSPVLYDVGALTEPLYFLLIKGRHFFNIELGKGISIAFSLLENSEPAQSRLGRF